MNTRWTPTGIYIASLIAIMWMSAFFPSTSKYMGQFMVVASIAYSQLLVYWDWIKKRDTMSAVWIYILLNSCSLFASIGIPWVSAHLGYILMANGFLMSMLMLVWVKR